MIWKINKKIDRKIDIETLHQYYELHYYKS